MKNRIQTRSLLAALAAALSLAATPPARAATLTWNGTGGATWNTTDTNWTPTSGTTPWDSTNGTTSNATFNNANGATVSGTVYANQIIKTDSAGTTTISGGNITLAGSSPTITNNGTAALTIGSKLSGSNGVTLAAGAINFNGANDYSGTTTINSNNVTANNNGAFGTSSVLVNTNGILKVGTSALSNNMTLNGNGGTGNGAIQSFATTTLSGSITLASSATIGNRASGTTLNLTGGITATGQTLTLSGVGGSSAISISTNVVNLGSGGTFRASAEPVTVNIGGNTWGTTLVDWGGTINLGATDALATASILQMGASGGGETATVDLKGFSQTIGGLRSFTGSGSASANGTRIVTNTGSAATLTVNNTTAYLYDGQINGAIALTKQGSSTLTLSGNNTYTGVTNVSAGILAIGSANALGDGSGQLTAAGGTLDLGGFTVVRSGTVTFSGGTVQNGTLTNNTTAYDAQSGTVSASLSGSAGLTKTTSGNLNLNNSNSYSGGTTISAGGITLNAAGALGSGSVVVASGARLNVSNAGPFSNNITINGNAGTGSGAIQAFTNTTLSGLITLASDATIGNRAVGTLDLTGGIAASNGTLVFNSVGGSVTNISTNVVNLGANGTFRASAAPLNVNIGGNTWGTTLVDWGGTINLGATDALATASILQMGASGGGETATVDLKGFSQTIGGLRSFTGSGSASANGTRIVTNTGSAATLTVNNTTAYLYDGQINGAIALTKQGSSTLTLSGSNTYTGNTAVSLGTLLVNGSTSASSAVSVSSGATLGGNGTVNGATTLAGGTIGSSGSTLALSSTLSSSGNSSVATGSTVNVAGGSTVTSGTLLINGTLGGALNVTGGTVGGNGTTAALTVGASGTLAPGNSPGILNTGNLSLSGALSMEINGATVGTQYDQVNVLGTVNLVGGNTLALTLGYTPTIGTNFFLINNDGGDAIVGNLNGYAQGATFTVSSQQFQISYTGDSGTNSFSGSGNDLVIQAVPEPATWALLAVSLTTVMVLRRRRCN